MYHNILGQFKGTRREDSAIVDTIHPDADILSVGVEETYAIAIVELRRVGDDLSHRLGS